MAEKKTKTIKKSKKFLSSTKYISFNTIAEHERYVDIARTCGYTNFSKFVRVAIDAFHLSMVENEGKGALDLKFEKLMSEQIDKQSKMIKRILDENFDEEVIQKIADDLKLSHEIYKMILSEIRINRDLLSFLVSSTDPNFKSMIKPGQSDVFKRNLADPDKKQDRLDKVEEEIKNLSLTLKG